MFGDLWDSLLSSWWGRFVAALFMFLVAWLLYDYLTDIEEVRGRGRVHWVVAISYNLVGKWGTVLLFVLAGATFALMGAHSLRERWRGDDE